jgi:type IV fimbrial biogenesis protein FimT
MFESRTLRAPHQHSSREGGFTLVELMVTLAIAAIVMTMAVPSFTDMTRNNRLTTQANQLVTALNLARSEAITRRVTVDVAATDAGDASNEWGEGWSVAVNGGATLRVFESLGSNTLDSGNDLATIQYQPSGRASATDMTLCDDRTGETGRQITILTTGRVTTTTVACP